MSALTTSATVCALVPHHDCADWLPGALDSLLAQTRGPDALVVLDDASPRPPLDVAGRYPEITFLRATENVGPYRLVQTVIDAGGFDAYLFQDADDLSHPERLATLLEVAEVDGADIVGSHEVELDAIGPEVRERHYPLDVNAALSHDPMAFALLHPTSLVSREAVARAGGFPGLRFSGDVDFLWRAGHVARIVNADRHLYLRRRHPGSLTGSQSTGTRSPARRRIDRALRARARARAEAVAAGTAPDLSPFATAVPVRLEHLSGPAPGTRLGAASSRPRPVTDPGPVSVTGPVLVVGGPRSGADVFARALDLHPRFELVADATALDRRRDAGRRPVLAGPAVIAAALGVADDHPDATVVCVERDLETTVASLLDRPDAHGDYYSRRSAHSTAARWATTCDLLAAALGGGRVLRVALADLIEKPTAALARCLAFLGEQPIDGVAAPLAGLRADARRRPTTHQAPPPPAEARRRLETGHFLAGDTLAGRVRRMVAGLVGDDDVVVVVSRGDESLLDLGAGRARHLPATDDGTYARDYPATGNDAVALVEAARGRGATHLLVPAPASWWLTHYPELERHLDRRYQVVAAADDTGVLYHLAPAERGQVAG
ncbi:MAG TPA: glycosyltransferase [Acidimicrobiales bacterium]|nr:glycosyltransferase [Acidimicrobiales bacterium]